MLDSEVNAAVFPVRAYDDVSALLKLNFVWIVLTHQHVFILSSPVFLFKNRKCVYELYFRHCGFFLTFVESAGGEMNC